MSNIIDTIRLSGTDYTLSATSSGVSVVEVTQAEYDALPTSAKTDTSKMYVITDAEAGDLTQYWTSAQTSSAITQAVSGKVDTGSVVSSVTSASTDNEIPTAKAVYDAVGQGGGGGTTYTAGRGIDITNDTISFSLPMSAGTGTNSIIGGDPHNTASNTGSIALGGWYNSQYSYGLCNASGKGAISLGGNASGEDSFTAAGTGAASGMRSAAIATYGSKAYGIESLATGRQTTANTFTSFAQGRSTKTTNEAEVALGEYNNSVSASTTFGDSGNTLFSVGNGTADNARHNAFEIRQNGDIYCSDGTNDVKLQDTITATASNTTALGGLSLVKLTQSAYDALSPNYDSNTLYVIVN